jgi:hypothetical protein
MAKTPYSLSFPCGLVVYLRTVSPAPDGNSLLHRMAFPLARRAIYDTPADPFVHIVDESGAPLAHFVLDASATILPLPPEVPANAID